MSKPKKTTFEQVLFCGKVRPVNYSAQAIVGSYDINGINIVLSENGTATISIGDVIIEAYYRIEMGIAFTYWKTVRSVRAI